MLTVVGELINSMRPKVGRMIAERGEAQIRDLARRQHEAGAAVIDLNAEQSLEHELEDLLWLIETVEDELGRDVCLAIDTSDPGVMEAAISKCSTTPMMNSISNEASKAPLIAVAAECGCDVIGLAMGEAGMPKTADERVSEAAALIEKCEAAGVPRSKIYIDLICMSIASSPEQGRELLAAVRRVADELSGRPLVALSNVSFGLPNRRLVNRAFLPMMVEAGLAGAILDPTDPAIAETICAANALLGEDEFCMEYIRHHRKRTTA
jgi:5-methyltetrahydrofolate--homocysteine methyltransferase